MGQSAPWWWRCASTPHATFPQLDKQHVPQRLRLPPHSEAYVVDALFVLSFLITTNVGLLQMVPVMPRRVEVAKFEGCSTMQDTYRGGVGGGKRGLM